MTEDELQKSYEERLKNRKRSFLVAEKFGRVKQVRKTRDNVSRKNKRAPVLQYTLEGVFIARYESIKAAEIAIGKYNCSGSIHHCCKGRYKSSCGFKWEYGG